MKRLTSITAFASLIPLLLMIEACTITPVDPPTNAAEPTTSTLFPGDIPNEFYLGTIVQRGGIAYLIGGHGSPSLASQQVRAFDLAARTWSSKAPMQFRRSNAGAFAIGNYIYVMGGRGNGDGDTVARKVERYDIEHDTWETLPDITLRNYDGTDANQFVTLGGKVYTVSTRRTTDDQFELYEWDGTSWTTYSIPHVPSQEPVLAASDSRLYIFGRSNSANYMYEFNPVTKSFTGRDAPADNDRSFTTRCYYYEGSIYKINSNENSARMLEIYDIDSDSWSRIFIPFDYITNETFQPIVTDAADGEVYYCPTPDVTHGFYFNARTREFSRR